MTEADITEELRRALIEAGHRGMTQYAIAKRAGVDRAGLIRFMRGERGVTLETAARLAIAIGFELALKRKRKQKR